MSRRVQTNENNETMTLTEYINYVADMRRREVFIDSHGDSQHIYNSVTLL